ncbi:MAG TPA: O-antigen ligase family protein [Bacillales bacterium]
MTLDLKKMIFLGAGIVALVLGIIFSYSFVGLAITLGFGIYALVRPKNALLFLFLYFPIRSYLIEFNPALKGIGDAVILFSLLRLVYDYRGNLKALFRFQWFEFAFFAFLLLGAISALLTGVSIVAIIFQLRAFILLYLVYYIAKRLEITKEDIAKLLWTTVVVVTIICIHGLIEKLSLRQLLLPPAWESRSLSPTNRIRIYGMVGNPNRLAIYLSFAFVLIMYLRKHLAGKWYWAMNVLIVLLFSVWFMTYSRGTWIAFVIATVLYIALTKNWRILKTLVISLAIGIILVALPVNALTNVVANMEGVAEDLARTQYNPEEGSFSERLAGTFDESYVEDSMRAGRLLIIVRGFEVFFDHPVIGTGFGTYGDSATLSYGSPIYDDYNIERLFYSDNQYIEIIVQTGVIGVILFAVFLLNMLYLIWKKRSGRNFAPVLLVLLLGAYAAGCYYNIWENDIFGLFYFAMLGYLLNVNNQTFRISDD